MLVSFKKYTIKPARIRRGAYGSSDAGTFGAHRMLEISIIVPVCNSERYLSSCLDSVLAQTFKDWEAICVDDGSTDGSGQILADYAARDPRIRVITQANAGTSAARNAGLNAATAPFIMFCDGDDWYEPTMCEKMHAAMQNGADMAICGVQEVYEKTRGQRQQSKYFRLPTVGEVEASDELLLRCDVCVWNKIYRREVLEQKNLRFPEGLRYEDEFFFACYTAYVQRICFVNESLYSYRRHEKSYMGCDSRKQPGRAKVMVEIANRIWQYYDKQGLIASHAGFASCRWLQLCMRAYRCAVSEEELAIVRKEAAGFVKERILPQKDLPAVARERFILLVEDRWERSTRKWGGLLRIVTKDKSTLTCCRMQTKCCLAGIPLLVQQRIHSAAP